MTSQRRERIDDLLADRALVGLGSDEAAELAQLMAEERLPDDASLDLAAAALMLAGGRASAETALPRQLAERLERAAGEHLGRSERTQPTSTPPELPAGGRNVRSTTAAGAQVVVMPLGAAADRAPDWTRWAGWLAAAAAACILVGQRVAPPPPASLAAAGAPADTRSIAIDAPVRGSEEHARGTLAWSAFAGRGDLRVRGLPTGDYELWVDDAARNDRQPLAAGAFHAVDGGEAIAEVAPAIAPREATQLRIVGLASNGHEAPAFTLSIVPR